MIAQLQRNPLNVLCRRLLLAAGQEPDPQRLHSLDLAQWAAESRGDLLPEPARDSRDRLAEFLAARSLPQPDLQRLLLPGDVQEGDPQAGCSDLAKRLEGVSPGAAGLSLLENLYHHLQHLPGFAPQPF